MADNFLDITDFSIEEYNPAVGSDSGVLLLASLKADPTVQYVIKSATPELACNEFMYHKIAAALGMYTQEVKLIRSTKQFPYAAGIRFAPDARNLTKEDIAASSPNFEANIAFLTLYVILNEEDSQEHYIDKDGRLFKLDNAVSFNLQGYQVAMLLKASEGIALELLKRGLSFTEYDKYAIILNLITEHHGSAGRDACLATFERFSQIDMDSFDEAIDAVAEMYVDLLGEYYFAFVESRKELCKQFLSEIQTS